MLDSLCCPAGCVAFGRRSPSGWEVEQPTVRASLVLERPPGKYHLSVQRLTACRRPARNLGPRGGASSADGARRPSAVFRVSLPIAHSRSLAEYKVQPVILPIFWCPSPVDAR